MATNILKSMVPSPTNSGFPFNFLRSDSLTNDFDQYMGRVDWNISPRHPTFAEYFAQNNSALGSRITPTSFEGNTLSSEDRAILSDTFTFSPSLLNEARLGYHREKTILGTGAPNLFPQLGINGITVPGAPLLLISDIGDFGEWGYPYVLPENVIQARDDFTYTRVRHTFKTGVDFERFEWNRTQSPNGRPTYSLTGLATGKRPTSNSVGFQIHLLTTGPGLDGVRFRRGRLTNDQQLLRAWTTYRS